MKMAKCLLFSVVVLAGCQEEPAYLVHQTGSDYADRSRAIDDCSFAAIQAVPRAMAVSVDPGYSSPGTVQCSTVGGYTSCNTIGAVNIPATSTTYDANGELRQRYLNRCLEDKGYSVLLRPQCRTQEEIARYTAFLDNQPPADQIACVLPR